MRRDLLISFSRSLSVCLSFLFSRLFLSTPYSLCWLSVDYLLPISTSVMLVVPMPPSHLPPSPPSSTPSSSSSSSSPSTVPSRPKLSLQTSALPRTFGRSTTGLSLLATSSPTVHNTFKNAYDAPAPPTTTTTTSTTSTTNHAHKPSKPLASPYPSYYNSNAGNPYQQPIGVKSILRNSPLEPASHRRSVSLTGTNTNTNGAAGSTRRPFFPAKKQVSYRQPLDEEIRTVHYLARHSDLIAEEDDDEAKHPHSQPRPQRQTQPPHAKEGSDSDSDSASSLAPSDTSSSDDDHHPHSKSGSGSGSSKSERKKRKSLSAERQVRAVALLDGLEGDALAASTPQTPCESRVKRRREWRWTLGSVEARNETYGLPRTPDEAENC